jgi:hypothetical protein
MFFGGNQYSIDITQGYIIEISNEIKNITAGVDKAKVMHIISHRERNKFKTTQPNS